MKSSYSKLRSSTHKMSNGTTKTYTKEEKALHVTNLLLKGFTRPDAEAIVNARYK